MAEEQEVQYGSFAEKLQAATGGAPKPERAPESEAAPQQAEGAEAPEPAEERSSAPASDPGPVSGAENTPASEAGAATEAPKTEPRPDRGPRPNNGGQKQGPKPQGGAPREGGQRQAVGPREGGPRQGGPRESGAREGGGPQGGPQGRDTRPPRREGGPRDDRGPRPGGDRFGGRPDLPPDIELEKLIADSLYLDNQAHIIVSRMRDMDSGTKSQLRRLYNAVRRAVRTAESERQHEFVMLRARLAYTIARHSLRSLDALERLLLQVTRKNDARGYERFRDLFEAIVAYNE